MKINFSPELIHIYGPFGIQAYGLFIALAIIITVYLIRKDKRFTELNLEPVYLNIVIVSIIAGCIGGRLLEVISEPQIYTHWYDWFALWTGGFSILGAILGIVTLVPFYLKKINVPILPTCDLVAIYAPLLQAIARLGCFTAGCCYGTPTHSIFAVIYTNAETFAPYGIAIHPTQVYSSIILFVIFLFMYFVGQKNLKRPGELFGTYLMLVAIERYYTDFWRSDRIMITKWLSFHQLVAFGIFLVVFIFMKTIFPRHRKKN
jgi:phosphatidylglycerol---prolipoprotein diacylglyceryl transferase